MNGPEHYREAERLIEAVDIEAASLEGPDGIPQALAESMAARWSNTIAVAQVHATLALAAATGTYGATSPSGAARSVADDGAWWEVAGP